MPSSSKALVALKPGEISPVIETQYGYHIIRRPTYDEVRSDIIQVTSKGRPSGGGEHLPREAGANGKIEVEERALPPPIRAMANDPDAHRRDKTVLATSDIGKFTGFRPGALAGDNSAPGPGSRSAVKSAPDSLPAELPGEFVRNELVLQAADSAKMVPDTAQLKPASETPS